MMRETETQEVISVFRPWDSQADSQDTKPVLTGDTGVSSDTSLTTFTNTKPLLRPKEEPSVRAGVRPKLEARETVSPAVRPGVINPLSIAMRGLVPAIPLPLPPPHPAISHLSIIQRRAVQDLQELQMAVALSEVTERKARPKKYKCDLCEACFSNNGQLRGHVRIHTGERPFKCTFSGCGKSFTRNEELTRHKRIHTGVKPFTCHVPGCNKPFGRKDHLKKHLKTHERMQGPYLGIPAQLLHHPRHPHPGLATLAQGWFI